MLGGARHLKGVLLKGCHPRVKGSNCFPSSIRKLLTRKKKKGGRTTTTNTNTNTVATNSVATTKKSNKTRSCMNHSDARCLLQSSDLPDSQKDKLARQYLRPPRPSAWASDPDQWLDSNNIGDVMKQYEETYKDFKFLGVLPIDFAAPDPYTKGPTKKCLIDKMCEIDIAALRRSGIDRLAAAFNLDPHFKDGSHWVACYVDLEKHRVYYFDSYGIRPPIQIAKFMRSLTLQDPKMELAYNGRRFQYQGSECGMYSLYFIISMLEGADFKTFCHHAVPDGEMLRLRHWLFS